MVSRFDPSSFIAAEEVALASAETLATIAASARVDRIGVLECKPAENCGFQGAADQRIATIAGIAGVDPQDRVWSDAPFILAEVKRPPVMKKSSWHRLLNLTEEMVSVWGEKASSFGWHPLEFFGCNRDPFAGRIDRDGVVMFLFRSKAPVQVTGVTADHVELTYGGKDVLRYRPFGPRGQVYLWDAYTMEGGP